MSARTPARTAAALVLLAVALVLLGASPASAHPSDATQLALVRTDDGAHVRIEIPRASYETATGRSGLDAAAVRADVAAHLALRALSGAPWSLTVVTVGTGTRGGIEQVVVELDARPPSGTDASQVLVDDDLVVDVLAQHEVYVTSAPSPDDEPTLVGMIDQRHTTLVVELGDASGVGFGEMFRRGVEHFRDGDDHQVFLVLVVAGSVGAAITAARRVGRASLRTLLFTVGHSTSLALATAGLVSPPSRVVESAIAVTILLGAAQLRFEIVGPRAESALTACFGFVHGFGFAGLLAGLGLHGGSLVVPTLGFNLGLEAAQVLATLAILPSLWILLRSDLARTVLAVLTAALATGWIVERGFAVTNPVEPLTGALVGSPVRLVVVLAAAAALSSILRALPSGSQRAHRSAPQASGS